MGNRFKGGFLWCGIRWRRYLAVCSFTLGARAGQRRGISRQRETYTSLRTIRSTQQAREHVYNISSCWYRCPTADATETKTTVTNTYSFYTVGFLCITMPHCQVERYIQDGQAPSLHIASMEHAFRSILRCYTRTNRSLVIAWIAL